MREELELELPEDPDECLHPNRPTTPRLADEGNTWHCTGCDTLFVVQVTTEPSWREL